MKPIIEVHHISKRFKIYHQQPYLSLRDLMTQAFRRMVKRTSVQTDKIHPPSSENFWALKEVSFNVYEGESVGIIGRNGAGKSTLLKILSRITPPTKGYVILRGRMASLLEVGTGFHPELTGRENVYFNGAILGMKRAEVKRKFDEIVDFAGVEKFIDTPLKHYSSGMQLRLSFAVAAFLEAEILVVDEVLAVGDVGFQKKCLGKMEEVTQKEGRTVLFVSHNMGAVKSLCQKAIWIDRGEMMKEGNVSVVIDQYITSTSDNDNHYIRSILPTHKGIYIKEVSFLNSKWQLASEIFYDEQGIVSILIGVQDKIEYTKIGVGVNNKYNNRVFSIYKTIDFNLLNDRGELRYYLYLPKKLLAPNIYDFSVGIVSYNNHLVDVLNNILKIKIIDNGSPLQEMEGIDYGDIIVEGKWEIRN